MARLFLLPFRLSHFTVVCTLMVHLFLPTLFCRPTCPVPATATPEYFPVTNTCSMPFH